MFGWIRRGGATGVAGVVRARLRAALDKRKSSGHRVRQCQTLIGLVFDIVGTVPMLVFRMRDDIHRRLPLPRAWKRVLKACSRDAEAGDRPTLLAQAAGSELRQLRPAVLDEVRRAFADSEGSLFPRESFRPSCEPRSPIEASLLRECVAIADQRLSAEEAIGRALTRALAERVGAVGREVRAQGNVDFPRDCSTLVRRFGEAAQSVDLEGLARRHVAGEAPPRATKLRLDLDADLRGSQ